MSRGEKGDEENAAVTEGEREEEKKPLKRGESR